MLFFLNYWWKHFILSTDCVQLNWKLWFAETTRGSAVWPWWDYFRACYPSRHEFKYFPVIREIKLTQFRTIYRGKSLWRGNTSVSIKRSYCTRCNFLCCGVHGNLSEKNVFEAALASTFRPRLGLCRLRVKYWASDSTYILQGAVTRYSRVTKKVTLLGFDACVCVCVT